MIRLIGKHGGAWLRGLGAVALLAGTTASAACGGDDDTTDDVGDDIGDDLGDDSSDDSSDDVSDDDGSDDGAVACDEDNGSITLPDGFCASVFADGLGAARHLTVSPSGDVFVAIADSEAGAGGVVALRDADGDGIAEESEAFGKIGGNGIAWSDDALFFAENDAIVRYELADGELLPAGEPEVVVSGLPAWTPVPLADRGRRRSQPGRGKRSRGERRGAGACAGRSEVLVRDAERSGAPRTMPARAPSADVRPKGG